MTNNAFIGRRGQISIIDSAEKPFAYNTHPRFSSAFIDGGLLGDCGALPWLSSDLVLHMGS